MATNKTMHQVLATAKRDTATYDYCHECGRLFYVRNVMVCPECIAKRIAHDKTRIRVA